MYQWLMQKPNRACGVSTSRNVMEDHTVLDLNAIEGPFDEEIRRGCDLCGESGQILCWHKVEEHFEFVFRVNRNVLLTSFLICSVNIKISHRTSPLTLFAPKFHYLRSRFFISFRKVWDYRGTNTISLTRPSPV